MRSLDDINEQRMRRSEAAVHMVMYCLAAAFGAALLVGYLRGWSW